MVAHVTTVAFQGVETRPVDVQVQLSNGLPAFAIVGLPDKAVAESKERVRAALTAIGLALPPKRITINLSPADLQKEGSHYDLPIALGLMLALEVIPSDALDGFLVLGELGLDSKLAPVSGVLPAAMAAMETEKGLICPAACGPEAVWAGDLEVLAPIDLLTLVNHFKGRVALARPEGVVAQDTDGIPDLRDIKGQEAAKRAIEIAAAGGHNLLMIGPPGAGKSMLAERLPGILPPLTPKEALELSLVQSVAGILKEQGLATRRPYRNPHHTVSTPALVGGGQRAQPGEISLSHNGVLFLDELPEFNRQSLESLRQPLETGKAVVARANAHVTYPARIQLIAAMNPCRCGHLDDPDMACSRVPRCALDYQAKISGPLFDRIDIHVDVPAVNPVDLSLPPPAEGSAEVAARVKAARDIQTTRYAGVTGAKPVRTNADADGTLLEEVAAPDEPGRALLADAATKLKLTARGYHRVLRVARTIADMEGTAQVRRPHIAEALAYRRIRPTG
ncbi:YifB family Mg chelatase-like AAA ATPase [Hwanghaeella sp.]|uniref:YifB family Mg chelatase-like AAA ATPase n=1 Tax=Hwanghaeella sp. TaxID=2605943 RepID=UPI003CCBD925